MGGLPAHLPLTIVCGRTGVSPIVVIVVILVVIMITVVIVIVVVVVIKVVKQMIIIIIVMIIAAGAPLGRSLGCLLAEYIILAYMFKVVFYILS